MSLTLALFGKRAVYCARLAIGADAEPKHVHPDWHCVGSELILPSNKLKLS